MAVTSKRIVMDSFKVSLQSTSAQPLKTYPVPDNTTLEVDIAVQARQEDSSAASAVMHRTLLLTRVNGGPVTLQGPVATWHADKTIKSNPAFDLGFTLGASTFTLTGTCATAAAATTWLAQVSLIKVT